MLRWTAASAVIAAALHGIIDVPWHRVSLGWFLLAIAGSSVPSSRHVARAPRLSRFLFVLGGLALMAAAGWIGYEKSAGRSPAPYRWPEIAADLQRLGEERRYEEAEVAAQKAVREFPLRYESYYWLAGHLRPFADTGPEIEAAVEAARAVEPVLAKVPEEQAVILQPLNPDGALAAWKVSIERAAAIDANEQRQGLPSAGDKIRKALAMFAEDTARQLALGQSVNSQPVLVAHWVIQANADAAASFLREAPNISQFVDSLPPVQRRQVLARWIKLPSAPAAVAFMEEREAVSGSGEYWPVLAGHYAAQGDLPRAVRRVASSCGISLDAPSKGEEGLRGQMGALIAQGNTVAARRLANDAVAAKLFVAGDLAAAMAYYASQEDWASAWKAGSRLATESKIGQ